MVKVTMVLADAATVSDGKLNLLGVGWNIVGPHPVSTAIGLIVDIPWGEANRRHKLRLGLRDADGEPVLMPGPEGSRQPIELQTELEVGRPPGVRPGTPLPVPLAIPVPPLPLAAGTRYVWQLQIDGHAGEDWRLAFDTRANDVRLVG